MPIPTNEDKTMKTHVSLSSLSAAFMLFVTRVAMHEAASADRLTAGESCTHGTNDITVCSDCDPDGVCVVTRCVDGRSGLATPCP